MVLSKPEEEKLTELEAWVKEHGSLPKQSAAKGTLEKRLAAWMCGCQDRFKRGTLQDELLELLGQVPGMEARIESWAKRRLGLDDFSPAPSIGVGAATPKATPPRPSEVSPEQATEKAVSAANAEPAGAEVEASKPAEKADGANAPADKVEEDAAEKADNASAPAEKADNAIAPPEKADNAAAPQETAAPPPEKADSAAAPPPQEEAPSQPAPSPEPAKQPAPSPEPAKQAPEAPPLVEAAPPVSRSDVDPELDAVLPPEPPPTSDAHKKVNWREPPAVPNAFAIAVYQKKGMPRVQVQAAISATGTRYCAERIVRACYYLLEEGKTKEEVMEFRQVCYDKLKPVLSKISAPRHKPPERNKEEGIPKELQLKRKASSKNEESTPKELQLKRNRSIKDEEELKASKKKKVEEEKEIKEEVKDKAPKVKLEGGPKVKLEDAPEGSLAWKDVKFDTGNKCWKFRPLLTSGEKVNFQTTINGASGDYLEAGRIARLCYLRFQQGQSKEEVLKYREVLYAETRERLGAPALPQQKSKDYELDRKRGRPPGTSKEEAKKKKKKKKKNKGSPERGGSEDEDAANGRPTAPPPAGSLRLEGRAADRINASINGVYVPLPNGFEGAAAFQKHPDQTSARRFFLFYAQNRNRWKVSDKLGDTKGGFAFIKADASLRTPADVPEERRWSLWDGKDLGYQQDENVRCFHIGSKAAVDASQPSQRSSQAEAASSKSSSSSGSDDDADNADSDSGESESSADSAIAAEQVAPGAAPTLERPAPKLQPLPPPKKGRIAAKMLTWSGLRCVCHFDLVGNCPARAARAR